MGILDDAKDRLGDAAGWAKEQAERLGDRAGDAGQAIGAGAAEAAHWARERIAAAQPGDRVDDAGASGAALDGARSGGGPGAPSGEPSADGGVPATEWVEQSRDHAEPHAGAHADEHPHVQHEVPPVPEEPTP